MIFVVFLGGFALMPLLWLINAIYMFPALKSRRTRIPKLKTYVYGSAAGTIAWFVLLTIWYVVFCVKRTSMGATGDALTVVIPKGY